MHPCPVADANRPTRFPEEPSDIAILRNEMGLLRLEFKSELKEGLDGLRDELRGELDGLRGELRGELSRFGGELGGFRVELGGFRVELGGLKGELLAAMRADKVDLLKWVVMLIAGQTAIFTALKVLGH